MKNKKNIWVFLSLIGIAALSRLLPHPPNFTAIGSMALFGGMVINSKYVKFLLPIAALLVSDLVLNNTVYYSGGFSLIYPGMLWVYSSFIVIALIGSLLKRVSVGTVFFGSLISAIFFFLFTNFGYWMSGITYPLTLSGLGACYVAALPFFTNSLVSTVMFSAILFGGYYYVEKKELSEVKA